MRKVSRISGEGLVKPTPISAPTPRSPSVQLTSAALRITLPAGNDSGTAMSYSSRLNLGVNSFSARTKIFKSMLGQFESRGTGCVSHPVIVKDMNAIVPDRLPPSVSKSTSRLMMRFPVIRSISKYLVNLGSPPKVYVIFPSGPASLSR